MNAYRWPASFEANQQELSKAPLSFGLLPSPSDRKGDEFQRLQALDTLITFLTFLWPKACWSMRPWESAPNASLFRGRPDSQDRMDGNGILNDRGKPNVNLGEKIDEAAACTHSRPSS